MSCCRPRDQSSREMAGRPVSRVEYYGPLLFDWLILVLESMVHCTKAKSKKL